MKSILTVVFLGISCASFAQTANFKSSTAKQEAGIHTKFECKLTDVGSVSMINSVVLKMKSAPGVLKVDALNQTDSSADLIIITQRENDVDALRNALNFGQVKGITLNGKKYKIAQVSKLLADNK